MLWFLGFYVLLKIRVMLTLYSLSGEEYLTIALLILNAFKYLFSLSDKTFAHSFSEQMMHFPSLSLLGIVIISLLRHLLGIIDC